MKKLIRGERYNQEIAMHTGYHLEITATETAYLVSGEDGFGRRDDSTYRAEAFCSRWSKVYRGFEEVSLVTGRISATCK